MLEMVEAQADDNPVIQGFLTWKESRGTQRLGCGGGGNEVDRKYLPYTTLEKKLSIQKIKELLKALFNDSDKYVPDAELIRKRYLRPFAILLSISNGRMIYQFVEHINLQNDFLPFHIKPHGFPSSTNCDLFEEFRRAQWEFCPVKLDYDTSCRLETDEIIPINRKEKIGDGGSAIIYKIVLDKEYDNLIPPGDGQDSEGHHQNVYVLKTFRTQEAERYYEKERNAYRKIRLNGKSPPNIIAFYGSFVHGETFSVIEEFADLGNLDNFMNSKTPPSSPNEKLVFWSNFLDVVSGLVRIHGEKDLLGWHQDVIPTNILVKSRKGQGPYDCDFMLSDLGLSHFGKHISPAPNATDRDTFGTNAYGAPETARSPNIEQCSLQVKQNVDVWSMGCVISEVATWVDQGWSKVAEYRRRRSEEMKTIGVEGDDFHIGGDVLDTVDEIHRDITEDPQPNDTITPFVVKLLVEKMLISPKTRESAKYIYDQSTLIINRAKARLDEVHATTSAEPLIQALPKIRDKRPKIPPNLPPSHNRQKSGGPSRSRLPYSDKQLPVIDDNLEVMDSASSSRAPSFVHHHDFYEHDDIFRPETELRPLYLPSQCRPLMTYQPRAQDQPQRRQHPSEGSSKYPHRQLCNYDIDVESTKGNVGFNRARRYEHGQSLIHESSGRPLYNGSKGNASLETPTLDLPAFASPQAAISKTPKPSLSYDDLSARAPSSHKKTQSCISLPVMSVKEGLKLKRDREHAKWPKFPHEQLFENLNERDHVFLIDNSESMGKYRPSVRGVLELLWYMNERSDPDFYLTTYPKKLKPGTHSKMLQELDKRYQDKLGKKDAFLTSIFHPTRTRAKAPRRLSLYVLTDGVWQPKTDLVREIETLVQHLLEHKLTKKQIGIQFIRFGNDPTGIDKLKKLDSGLGLELDILDTTPADGNVWKMFLGAINNWFDGDGESEDEGESTSPRGDLNGCTACPTI